KGKSGNSGSHYRLCVPPCKRYITSVDTHSICVVCLGAGGLTVRIASSFLCGRSAPGRLSLRREPSPAFPRVLAPLPLRRRGCCTLGVRNWICWREWTPYLLPHPTDPWPVPRDRKPTLRLLPPHGKGSSLHLSSSEEGDLESTVEEPLPQLLQYEELLEVVTRAVSKLNIDWPAEGKAPRRSLPFFPDLHAEISRSWARPFLARLFDPASDYYGNVAGLDERAYKTMPRVEQTLASSLSPGATSSLKAPTLPSKPLRTTAALVGKGYTAA
ncbi:hypothetical protein M9458_028907, partial [Cirrhinus mrigala]